MLKNKLNICEFSWDLELSFTFKRNYPKFDFVSHLFACLNRSEKNLKDFLGVKNTLISSEIPYMTESSNSKNLLRPNSSWVEIAYKCQKPEKICPCCLRQIFYCWPKSLLQVDNSDLHETIDLTAALRLDKKDRLRLVTKVTKCSDHKEDHSASPGRVSSALSKLSREVELLIPKIQPTRSVH